MVVTVRPSLKVFVDCGEAGMPRGASECFAVSTDTSAHDSPTANENCVFERLRVKDFIR